MKIKVLFVLVTAFMLVHGAKAQLILGGYGEVALSRNFFSDNINRYTHAADYAKAGSHGRFDLPHVAFAVGYNFGGKWKMYSEIEFEHGGTESAVELEAEEAGEYEGEIERGGEVVLEQFWIERTFSEAFNIRAGHIIVPVGYTNGRHLPNEFFTVFRPEGENTILPCTWHETGISLWGRIGVWRYEAQLLPGLDSELFSRREWIGGASASPYEFKVANKYAGLLRIDNYGLRGLRIGAAAYYGYSFNNSIQPSSSTKYSHIKGAVGVYSLDFDYKGGGIIARGYFDYGRLGDSEEISKYNKSLTKNSPSPRTNVASEALCTGIEAGYDFMPFIAGGKYGEQKLYAFGRYEYYDSMYRTTPNITDNEWCGRQRISGGFNYFPINEVVVKLEYAAGLLKSQYNNENSLMIGIAYSGFFN
ncbi:MAG: hypothetical protein LBD28_03515 [Tannerellaceae bacterium]|nr:hypothetical protein [Tannerellaceae bacterium]